MPEINNKKKLITKKPLTNHLAGNPFADVEIVKIKLKNQIIQTIIFFNKIIFHLKHLLLREHQLYMLKTNQLTNQYNKGAIVVPPVQSFHF